MTEIESVDVCKWARAIKIQKRQSRRKDPFNRREK
jgi:hypothetical protein